ncbi:hypothetical protein GCM10027589_47940 [Actinocorallia lasiicapitis]
MDPGAGSLLLLDGVPVKRCQRAVVLELVRASGIAAIQAPNRRANAKPDRRIGTVDEQGVLCKLCP